MDKDHASRRQAFGPRGAYVVFTQHFKHRGAGHPCDHRQRNGAQHDGRQDQVTQRIDERAFFITEQSIDQHEAGFWLDVVEQVDTTRYRGPAQRYREEHDQDQTPPEDRHRVSRKRNTHYPMVEQGSSSQGRDDTGQKSDDASEYQRRNRQFQGGREQRSEFGPHARARPQRFAQVAMGELADVIDVLRIKGLVQAKTFHGLGVHFRIDPAFTHHDFDRVARNQANQREGQQGDAEEGGY